jgi:hypothetical protein
MVLLYQLVYAILPPDIFRINAGKIDCIYGIVQNNFDGLGTCTPMGTAGLLYCRTLGVLPSYKGSFAFYTVVSMLLNISYAKF